MTLELDKETLEMIDELKMFAGDESYANHLAWKIVELYEAQS